MTPDEEHVRAPGPSHPAFDACFEAHYSDILAFAVRRVDARTTAEDVLSETFAVAWRRRDAIPKPALPWLYGIAIRVIANEHRSSRRRARLRHRLAAEPPRTGRDPADLAGEREAVLLALSRLTEAQREILRLAAWEGLDAQDAAAVLDCTPSTFRVRLHRARRELAKQLEAAGHLPNEQGATAGPKTAELTE